jgi:hypothetical protein
VLSYHGDREPAAGGAGKDLLAVLAEKSLIPIEMAFGSEGLDGRNDPSASKHGRPRDLLARDRKRYDDHSIPLSAGKRRAVTVGLHVRWNGKFRP